MMRWSSSLSHANAWPAWLVAMLLICGLTSLVNGAEPAVASAETPESRGLAEVDRLLAVAVKEGNAKEQESLHARAVSLAKQGYERVQGNPASSKEAVAAALQIVVNRYSACGKQLSDVHNYQQAQETYQALVKLLTPVVDRWDWRLVDARLNEREADRYAKASLSDAIKLVGQLASISQAYALINEGRYRDAVSHLEDTAKAIEAGFGADSPEYFQAVMALAGIHRQAGHYPEAEAGYERTIKLATEIYGRRHPQYAEALNMLGSLRFSQDRHAEAAKMFDECLEIYRATIGEENADYALVLNNLAASYNNLERFDESEPLLKRTLELQRKLLGDKHVNVALALNNLGYLYDTQGRDTEATAAYQESLDLYEALLGPKHPSTLDAVQMLADMHYKQGRYTEAESLFFRVRDGRKEMLGEKHPSYGASLTMLGFLYRTQGAFTRAEPLLKEALDISRTNFGSENSRYANGLSNLGSLYWSQGSYEQAADIFKQSLAIYAKTSGTGDSWYAQTLANLGAAYNEMGRYVEAEPILRRSAEIYERQLGPQHTQLALALGNLSVAVCGLGDAAEEDRLDRRVVEIYRKAYGEKHISYAHSLGNLAGNYLARNDLPQAEAIFKDALTAYAAAVGPEHPEYAFYLLQLASTQMQQNRLPEAEQSMRRAQEIQLNNLGETHSQYVGALADFGTVLLLQQRLDEAEAVFRRGMTLTEKSGVNTEEGTTRFYNGLARVAHARGDDVAAERYSRQAVEQSFAWSDKTMQSQSERRQLALVTTNHRYFNNYLTIAVDSGKFADTAYRFAFRRKGNAWMQQRRIRAVTDDPMSAPLFAELQTTASKLAQQAMNAPKPELREVWQKEVEALTKHKESLEARLATSSEAYRRSLQAVTVEDLQASLPADAAMVDFVEYGYTKKPSAAGIDGMVEQRFAAFVVRPGKPVELIDLGEAKSIVAAIDRWREAYVVFRPSGNESNPDGVAAGKQLQQQLWEPLETKLSGAKLVFISPDGALGRFPFAALPGRDPKNYLIEDYALASVPVPQALPDMLKSSDAPRPAGLRNLLLVGGIDYDADASAGVVASVAPKKVFGGSRQVTRGAEWKNFEALPGMAGEVAVIQKTYEDLFGPDGLTTLEKGAASEERITVDAPKHQFLHIATHGFFAPPSLRSAVDASLGSAVDSSSSDGTRSLGSGTPTAAGLHPGLLSGIALAGANRPVTADRADGILTAEEVQTLDLRHVRLTVLSACETGLGETAGGEGVLGLQRAFQVAGARTTVTSLWKVDDIQTRALMERFYRNIWDKEMTLADGLREAQLWMIRGGDKRDVRIRPPKGAVEPEPETKASPFYWAAFILSGDWRQVQ